MNIGLLTKLALWLEGGAEHKTVTFDMGKGIEFKTKDMEEIKAGALACRTACCLAGAAVQFFNEPDQLVRRAITEELWDRATYEQLPWYMVKPEAARVLGLDVETADALFLPSVDEYIFSPGTASQISPAWAARVVRKLIKDGTVDWAGTRQPEDVIRVDDD